MNTTNVVLLCLMETFTIWGSGGFPAGGGDYTGFVSGNLHVLAVGVPPALSPRGARVSWVAVKELGLSYHNMGI